MTGRLETIQQRVYEAVDIYLGWLVKSNWTLEEKRIVLVGVIFDIVMREKKQTADAIHYRAKPKPVPKIFPAFPFEGHRTLAEVMDTGDVA